MNVSGKEMTPSLFNNSASTAEVMWGKQWWDGKHGKIYSHGIHLQ